MSIAARMFTTHVESAYLTFVMPALGVQSINKHDQILPESNILVCFTEVTATFVSDLPHFKRQFRSLIMPGKV